MSYFVSVFFPRGMDLRQVMGTFSLNAKRHDPSSFADNQFIVGNLILLPVESTVRNSVGEFLGRVLDTTLSPQTLEQEH